MTTQTSRQPKGNLQPTTQVPESSQVSKLQITRKPRFFRSLTALSICLVVAPEAFCARSATPAEIAGVVSSAATYEPGQSREPLRRIEEWVGQSVSDGATRKAIEAGLVQLLAPSATFEARRFACKQLGIIGSKAALPALAPLLRSDETASIACLAISTYPPGSADEMLRDALGSAPNAARIQIINTLGDRRDKDSVKLLAQWASAADPSVAEASIAALGKIGNEDAWKALTGLRKAAPSPIDPVLTEAAIRCAAALAASGDDKLATAAYQSLLLPSQPPYVRRAAMQGLLQLDRDQGELRILQAVRGSDAAVKPVAIAAVPCLRSKRASEKFASELPRLQPQEQVWLIDSLVLRADPAARSAIAQSLAAPDPEVRRAAIAALGRVGDASSVALFARVLASSDDAEERRTIESALIGLSGGPAIDKAILGELNQSSSTARASLIGVLARRQGPVANPVFFEEADNADPVVAQAAFRALAKTAGASDLSAVLRKLLAVRDAAVRAEAENAAAQVIGKLDDAPSRSAAVLDALRRAQGDDSIIALLRLLPRCGDAQALVVLKAAQQDSSARVRETAVRALAEWPDTSAWDVLVGIYRQGSTETLRSLALRGLVRLVGDGNAHPDAILMERYRQLLSASRGDADLKLILGALGAAAHADALQLASPLLANAGTRPEAEAAVRKIAESIKAQHPEAAREALRGIQAQP